MAEASKKLKDLDDWLPITKSRNAKWWYSAFHNVTAMVGAGVLGLPYAMAQLGWYAIFVIWLKIVCTIFLFFKMFVSGKPQIYDLAYKNHVSVE
jgi:amino acid permease